MFYCFNDRTNVCWNSCACALLLRIFTKRYIFLIALIASYRNGYKDEYDEMFRIKCMWKVCHTIGANYDSFRLHSQVLEVIIVWPMILQANLIPWKWTISPATNTETLFTMFQATCFALIISMSNIVCCLVCVSNNNKGEINLSARRLLVGN